MNRYEIYEKGEKLSVIYILLLIVVIIYLFTNILGFIQHKSISYYVEDTIKRIEYENFIKSIFTLNPNLEYLCLTENEIDEKVLNKAAIFTNLNVPLLDYLLNNEIIIDNSITEIALFEDNESESTKAAEEKNIIVEDEKFLVDKENTNTKTVEPVNYTLEQLNDLNFLVNNLYTVDSTIKVDSSDFDIDYFLNYNSKVDLTNNNGPKILIYHTHSQEDFIDSEKGNKNDTVVGVGAVLAKILTEEYGIEVIHHTGEYDIINGKLDRSKSYGLIEKPLKEIIAQNPSIEVLIDIHRDGVAGDFKFETEIDGKPTAKIMFFNGLAKIMENGKMVPLTSLPNKYVKENMAFSFQMHMKANELYPGITRKIYLKGYRYNLHLKPKSLLIEVGNQNNTVEEAKNAMEPLAKIIYEVISE